MTRKYLVTGGTGFIGSASVRSLLVEGHAVRVLDNNSRGDAGRLEDIADDIEFFEADVRDQDRVSAAAKGMDCVLHLAAVNGTEFFYSQPELVLDVGVRGMLAVIDACRNNDIGELIVASSSEVYQTPPSVPTDEKVPLSIPDPMNPRYSYAGSKIISELIAINYGRTGFSRVMVFRPHNVYGPDMGWEHVLPQFAMRAADAVKEFPDGPVPFPIQGDGSQTRAFIHIDDFCVGLKTVLEKGAHNETYNIGNPEELSIAYVARMNVAHFERQANLIVSEAPEGATPRRCPDISKLQRLGFSPSIPLKKGLPSLVEWYAVNRSRRPTSNAH